MESQVLMQEGYQAIEITNELVRYRFSERGGVLEAAYVHFASYGSAPVETVPGWQGKILVPGASLPFEVWVGDSLIDDAIYQSELSDVPEEGKRLTLTAEAPGLEVEKAFTILPQSIYTMDVEIRFRGQGHIRIILGYRPSGKNAPDLAFLYDGQRRGERLSPGSYTQFQGLGLVGGDTVYFLRLEEPGGFSPFLGANAAGQPVFGLEAKVEGEVLVRGVMYTGRDRYLLLQKAGLEVLGRLNAFSQFLVWVMRFFELLYWATGNYGWAIILFTFLIRAIVHPLNRSQMRSMAKMQRLAPKIQKLQERYKDDRQTLQKQMMELYRQERVNPLGGCLPMLLQFPILILLWQAIMYSAELIHLSPGFLWIPDLSLPDPYYILVVLATAAMLLQQWFTQRRMPTQASGGGQLIGWIFPLIMAVLFLGFPAALWLYWFFTTILQVGEQWIVNRELAREGAKRANATSGS